MFARSGGLPTVFGEQTVAFGRQSACQDVGATKSQQNLPARPITPQQMCVGATASEGGSFPSRERQMNYVWAD